MDSKREQTLRQRPEDAMAKEEMDDKENKYRQEETEEEEEEEEEDWNWAGIGRWMRSTASPSAAAAYTGRNLAGSQELPRLSHW